MSAPNETPVEDLRNALQLLYAVLPADEQSQALLTSGRLRVLRAVRKLSNEESPAAVKP